MHRAFRLAGFAIAAVARARGTNTHGRWPWVAAVLAPPATIAAYENRDRFASSPGGVALLASLPVLFWHQTEEWVLPAGFLPWINHSLFGSEHEEFPLDRAIGFRVNVLAGWGASAAAGLSFPRHRWLSSAVLASHAANGALHLGMAVRQRRYNPGTATALLLGPIGVLGATGIVRAQPGHQALIGPAIGLALSAALPLSLRRRASE